MQRLEKKKCGVFFCILAGILIITAIIVPIPFVLQTKTDEEATTTTVRMEATEVTTPKGISSTIKGQSSVFINNKMFFSTVLQKKTI
jgi:hypothetical protein